MNYGLQIANRLKDQEFILQTSRSLANNEGFKLENEINICNDLSITEGMRSNMNPMFNRNSYVEMKTVIRE
jgi:hypothetical protein